MNERASDYAGRPNEDDATWAGVALTPPQTFFPGSEFRITASLPASTTVAMLRTPAGRTVPVLSKPDEYYGAVVTYANEGAPIRGFAFTRRYLRPGLRFRFGSDVTFFSTDLNLLRASLWRVDGRA